MKTRKKNNWIFIFNKASSETYKGRESITILGFTYFFNDDGLKVFKVIPGGGLAVYTAHFFTRYNERMKLGLTEPLDIVVAFFINNGYNHVQLDEKGDSEFFTGVCKQGYVLGECQNHRRWVVYKTFITSDMAGKDQNDLKNDLKESLQNEIELELNQPEFNKEAFQYNADAFSGIY